MRQLEKEERGGRGGGLVSERRLGSPFPSFLLSSLLGLPLHPECGGWKFP
jgi:hypothetical protein